MVEKEKPKRKGKPGRYRHWPIVTFGLAIVLVGANYISRYSLPVHPDYYEGAVIYRPLTAFQSGEVLLIVFLLLICSALGIAVEYRGITRVVTFLGLAAFSYFAFFYIVFDSTPMRHIATTTYEDRVYHAVEIDVSWDGGCFEYYVYQCDESGIWCQIRLNEPDQWGGPLCGFDAHRAQTVSFTTSSDGQLQLIINEDVFDIPTE